MSNGIPTVMSKLSAGSFRLSNKSNSTCVGGDIESFKDCVISMYENEDKWNSTQKGGFEFIRRTHSLEFVQSKWKRLIDQSMKKIKEVRRNFPAIEISPEGELFYLEMYPDVSEIMKEQGLGSAFEHYRKKGKSEGKKYFNIHHDNHLHHGLFKADIQQFRDVIL